MSNRHKVFVSYHHANDQAYRDEFERLMVDYYDIMISKSVNPLEIDDNLSVETIRQRIRDEYLRDSTVTVVLIGRETWQRKHVDWEIGSSIWNTQLNPRSGLLGIFLPSHPDYGRIQRTTGIMPPRLFFNHKCGYAGLMDWSINPFDIQYWIHQMYLRRKTVNPNNTYPSFKNNRSGSTWQRIIIK